MARRHLPSPSLLSDQEAGQRRKTENVNTPRSNGETFDHTQARRQKPLVPRVREQSRRWDVTIQQQPNTHPRKGNHLPFRMKRLRGLYHLNMSGFSNHPAKSGAHETIVKRQSLTLPMRILIQLCKWTQEDFRAAEASCPWRTQLRKSPSLNGSSNWSICSASLGYDCFPVPHQPKYRQGRPQSTDHQK